MKLVQLLSGSPRVLPRLDHLSMRALELLPLPHQLVHSRIADGGGLIIHPYRVMKQLRRIIHTLRHIELPLPGSVSHGAVPAGLHAPSTTPWRPRAAP
eukprot:CAMPEP_0182525804 /NCGR_PEP_ID=MMETSP1323-20130603/2737_1 /TAXON_ID=236787 /ORGANISM="Florenciella parvula, Strain RCC1693" /LENGTH=97 /DNA_ID=CAMNT_0024734563 /DNA_START=332 /DNA_END=622 /DNA_ORIENTATION=+